VSRTSFATLMRCCSRGTTAIRHPLYVAASTADGHILLSGEENDEPLASLGNQRRSSIRDPTCRGRSRGREPPLASANRPPFIDGQPAPSSQERRGLAKEIQAPPPGGCGGARHRELKEWFADDFNPDVDWLAQDVAALVQRWPPQPTRSSGSPWNLKLQQPQRPRLEPDRQPVESSQLTRLSEWCSGQQARSHQQDAAIRRGRDRIFPPAKPSVQPQYFNMRFDLE
jgi:hypothetical protein